MKVKQPPLDMFDSSDDLNIRYLHDYHHRMKISRENDKVKQNKLNDARKTTVGEEVRFGVWSWEDIG